MAETSTSLSSVADWGGPTVPEEPGSFFQTLLPTAHVSVIPYLKRVKDDFSLA